MTVEPIAQIPGMFKISLDVHGDSRGWFKENWQRAKMVAAGLPDIDVVQNNMSFNETAGVTRGLHAEPWNKIVSVGTGKVFGAWVDLRAGETFGYVFTAEIDPSVSFFIPRGVANGYQTLASNTLYSYLVDAHWSADAQYKSVNLADPELGIVWPIPLDRAELSEKDKNNPPLNQVESFNE
jgi:dTDP-4-dehydrorhamnose 3,5-epimerase